MNKLFISLFAIFAEVKIANAQEISGIVVDERNLPIFAANVYFESNPNNGTISDLNGYFSIPYTYDNDTLIITFIGYQKKRILAIELEKGSKNIITLNTDPVLLDAVIARSTPISEQFSTEKLSSLDIYMNPVSQADPLKAIINMTASTNSDESANPSLRGSSYDRSRVIYNGVPIYQPVRASSLNNIGFFSIFNPEMIDVQTVYPSNPPLITGNASGG